MYGQGTRGERLCGNAASVWYLHSNQLDGTADEGKCVQRVGDAEVEEPGSAPSAHGEHLGAGHHVSQRPEEANKERQLNEHAANLCQRVDAMLLEQCLSRRDTGVKQLLA